jgi:pentatricopeptide repeat protein
MASTRKVEKQRKSTQLLLLSRAFDVLDRMKAREVDRDDLVYRALIDAACRIGSTHHAIMVLKEMRHDRCRPSALFFSCLLSAFAMDGTLKSGGAGEQLPMGELTAWMSESAETAPSVDSRTESRKSKRGGHEKRTATQTQVEMAMTTTGSTPQHMTKKSMDIFNEVPGTGGGETGSQNTLGSGNNGVHKTTAGTGQGQGMHPETKGNHTNNIGTIAILNGNLSRPGYSLLQALFPSLHIETEMETCPKCSKSLDRTWGVVVVVGCWLFFFLCFSPIVCFFVVVLVWLPQVPKFWMVFQTTRTITKRNAQIVNIGLSRTFQCCAIHPIGWVRKAPKVPCILRP